MIKMLSNVLVSFPLISSWTGYSKLSPRTSQLSSSQSLYKNITHFLEPPDLQPIYLSKYLIRPSLSLAPLDDFSDIFFTLEGIKEEDQLDDKDEKLIKKVKAKKIILEEDFTFDSDCNSKSVNNSNLDKPVDVFSRFQRLHSATKKAGQRP